MQNNTSIPEIVKTLTAAHTGSLRQLAESIGYPASFAGTLSDILRGRDEHVARETYRGLAVRLGLPPLPEVKPTEVCPTCWAAGKRTVHAAGDCHGRPVAAVVVLAPGEVVASAPPPKPPKRTRKHYRRPCFDDDPAVCLDQLALYTAEVEAELICQRATEEP